jgi:hypothetical protein
MVFLGCNGCSRKGRRRGKKKRKKKQVGGVVVERFEL